jgi:hypothetical protein
VRYARGGSRWYIVLPTVEQLVGVEGEATPLVGIVVDVAEHLTLDVRVPVLPVLLNPVVGGTLSCERPESQCNSIGV